LFQVPTYTFPDISDEGLQRRSYANLTKQACSAVTRSRMGNFGLFSRRGRGTLLPRDLAQSVAA